MILSPTFFVSSTEAVSVTDVATGAAATTGADTAVTTEPPSKPFCNSIENSAFFIFTFVISLPSKNALNL